MRMFLALFPVCHVFHVTAHGTAQTSLVKSWARLVEAHMVKMFVWKTIVILQHSDIRYHSDIVIIYLFMISNRITWICLISNRYLDLI